MSNQTRHYLFGGNCSKIRLASNWIPPKRVIYIIIPVLGGMTTAVSNGFKLHDSKPRSESTSVQNSSKSVSGAFTHRMPRENSICQNFCCCPDHMVIYLLKRSF